MDIEKALGEQLEHQKLVLSRLFELIEHERKQMAGELLDDVAQILAGIKYSVERFALDVEKGTARPETGQSLIRMIQYAMFKVYRIFARLRPSVIDNMGILAGIDCLCRDFESIAPAVDINKRLLVRDPDIPERLKIVIYRVIEEALKNVALYSKASLVQLSFENREKNVELLIIDNGVGLNVEQSLWQQQGNKGPGLLGLMEQVALSGGRLTVDSGIGKGTTIRAVWDLARDGKA
ncbi:MAG: ATP-binding protein [Pseudomonadota bacterium]